MIVDTERLRRFEAGALAKGAHGSIESGACVMEWAAYLANEPHSDAPACVSPAIAELMRSWNDSLDEKKRQMLKPYALRVLGTAGTLAHEERRVWLATDWLVREYTPAWLELAGLTEDAATLRALPEVDGAGGVANVITVMGPIGKRSAAAWDAAWDAAWAAAGDAARTAAWAAAGDAAGDAARAAAWAAARDAARAAAWAAAWAAAGKKLSPTVERLQISALALLDRMIAVRK